MKYAIILLILVIVGIASFFLFFQKEMPSIRTIENREGISQPTEADKNKSSGEQKVITAFGDSLTAGYNLPIESSYPSLLEKKIQENEYNYRVVNSGSSGDTTAAGLGRIDWVLNTKPDIVILTFGGNDAFRGVDPVETKKNLAEMIKKLQAANVKVLLGGMYAPRNLGKQYYEQFDAIYHELAEEYDVELIPFFLEGVALDERLNLPDGIHPTEEGYQIIVDKNIWPKLEGMLEK